MDDLFDDFFAPISRDGAGLLEVDIRLLKALSSLAEINPMLFERACKHHAHLLMLRANASLTLEHERNQLALVARTLSL